jgi:molybdenum cofactor biosynthesis protein A
LDAQSQKGQSVGNSPPLQDQFGRTLDYLRIAVTDRCNLRCTYCMPEDGIHFVSRDELLHYEELARLVSLFVQMGTTKVRITGGEPFIRKDILHFLEILSKTEGLQSWSITTNGTNTAKHIPNLKELGIKHVNLSLDTLDKDLFFKITRRDEFEKVQMTLHELLLNNISTKINMVVMPSLNLKDIPRMAELTLKHPLEVRFIEEMPFNGGDHVIKSHYWDYRAIKSEIEKHFGPLIQLATPPNSTAELYKIPDSAGHIGIIPAFSRTICGTCNRLRLTPQGVLKTCLYDKGVFNIRDLMRAGATDEEIQLAITEAVRHKAIDGFTAEKRSQRLEDTFESMTTIGG